MKCCDCIGCDFWRLVLVLEEKFRTQFDCYAQDGEQHFATLELEKVARVCNKFQARGKP